ncbi:hypothetical protein D9M73_108620 [compost metagenome]
MSQVSSLAGVSPNTPTSSPPKTPSRSRASNARARSSSARPTSRSRSPISRPTTRSMAAPATRTIRRASPAAPRAARRRRWRLGSCPWKSARTLAAQSACLPPFAGCGATNRLTTRSPLSAITSREHRVVVLRSTSSARSRAILTISKRCSASWAETRWHGPHRAAPATGRSCCCPNIRSPARKPRSKARSPRSVPPSPLRARRSTITARCYPISSRSTAPISTCCWWRWPGAHQWRAAHRSRCPIGSR